MKGSTNFPFGHFCRKNWWIILILLLIPTIALVVFAVLMANKGFNISDLGSMLGGLLAYLGTVILGFVSVWQVERQRQENLLMLEEQHYQANKGSLQFFVEIVHNNAVLVVKNFGKSEIYNGSITFNKEWIDELGSFGDMGRHVQHALLKSLSQNISMSPNQEIRFLLNFTIFNNPYYNFLINKNCKGQVTYDTLGKTVKSEFDYSFHAVLTSYYGLTGDDKELSAYEKMHREQLSKLNQIDKTLGSIEKAVSNLPKQIKK